MVCVSFLPVRAFSAILFPGLAFFFLCISVLCQLPGLLAVLCVALNASALEPDKADPPCLFDAGAVVSQRTPCTREPAALWARS